MFTIKQLKLIIYLPINSENNGNISRPELVSIMFTILSVGQIILVLFTIQIVTLVTTN